MNKKEHKHHSKLLVKLLVAEHWNNYAHNLIKEMLNWFSDSNYYSVRRKKQTAK